MSAVSESRPDPMVSFTPSETKEIEKLVQLFKDHHVTSYRDLEAKQPQLANHYFKQLSATQSSNRIGQIFKEATRLSLQPSTAETLDMKRLESQYDLLSKSKKGVEKLSQTLKDRIGQTEPVHVKNIVIGAGDAATEYWTSMQAGAHGRTHKLLQKDPHALPEVLMLAQDTGNWKHDYTLAQRYGLLERPDAPSTPQNFSMSRSYQENRHVNARFVYQSNLVNLSQTEAPVVLDTKVLVVEKRENHAAGWEVPEAPCRVKIQMKVGQASTNLPVATEKATYNLYKRIHAKDPTPSEAQALTAKLTPLSTYVLLDMMREDRFAEAQHALDLPLNYTRKDLCKDMALYLHELQENTLAAAPKEPGVTVKASLDGNEAPLIVNGKMAVVKERFTEKYLYADQVNVCGGFGDARKLAPVQLGKGLEHLSRFNPGLGYTPIVDGNAFMLTSREEGTAKKNIIVYGGGGNATACYRKAFFRQDRHSEDRQFSSENQAAEHITWFSRDGFELAGYGKLAKTAIEYANKNEQLASAELIKVEEGPHGKIHLFFKDVPGTYEQKPISMQDHFKQNHPLIEIPNPARPGEKILVRRFECDQFVYTIGQDPSPLKQLFNEFEGEREIFKDEASQMPLGVKTKNGTVQFWGATATVASASHKATVEQRIQDIADLEAEYLRQKTEADTLAAKAKTPEEKSAAELKQKQADLFKYRIGEAQARKAWTTDRTGKGLVDWVGDFNDTLRDWIVVQRIARDAEWPGVMPPSRVSARQAAFLQRNQMANEIETLNKEIATLRVRVREAQIKLLSQKAGTAEFKAAEKEKTKNIEALESLKNKRRTAQTQFTSANVNLDNIEYINGFLIRAKVEDSSVRARFLTALLQAREEAHANQEFTGISAQTLDRLLAQFGLQDRVTRQGHCSLTLRL